MLLSQKFTADRFKIYLAPCSLNASVLPLMKQFETSWFNHLSSNGIIHVLEVTEKIWNYSAPEIRI